ncbi:MAG: tetratricopeptide repeat protein [Spirosomataceae bacterium]
MKVICTILTLFVLWVAPVSAQQSPSDSLIQLLAKPMPDTSRVLLLDQVGRTLMYSKPLVAMQYAKEGLTLAEKLNYQKGIARNLNRLGSILRRIGSYPDALAMHLQSLKVAEQHKDLEGMAKTLNNIGILYSEQKDSRKAISYFLKTNTIALQLRDENLVEISLLNIGSDYAILNQLDSAEYYTQKAYLMALKRNSENQGELLINLGNILSRKHQYSQSLTYYRMSVPYLNYLGDNQTKGRAFLEMAQVFRNNKQVDSSLYYAKQSLRIAQEVNNPQSIYDASMLLTKLYETQNESNSYHFFKLAIAAKDSMFNQEKVKQLQNIGFQEELRLQKIKEERIAYQNNVRTYALLAGLAVVLTIALILYRNNQQKQKANVLLQAQQEEIKQTLSQLKITQKQLIQKEKLASLGELTAGIAHEIQNPLNFVNNFSQLSMELMNDLRSPSNSTSEEVRASLHDWEADGLGWEVLGDIQQNLEKIQHHGKRASKIVAGMLEHAQIGTGEPQTTNLHALANSFLNLSYRGMKAKHGDLEASYELVSEENLPLVSCVPQEIGRVLQNLLNNAFYSVWQRQTSTTENYQPFVKLHVEQTTYESIPMVALRIKDNGTGIPHDVLPKIFNPFFTTKPTGEGTGLGLSLSYEIITQGHNGQLLVETTVGQGSQFSILLPIEPTTTY